MKLIINKDRTIVSLGTWGTENENNYEILDFEFPEELEEYNKRIVYYLDDERKWDIILNNRVFISNAVTKYETVKAYVWLTKSEEIILKYICSGTETGSYYFTYDNETYYFIMPEIQKDDELIFDVATSTLKLNDTEISISTVGLGTELEFSTLINAAEDFRTKLFSMNFYENENADGIIPTPEEVDGFNTMITTLNGKLTEIAQLEDELEQAEIERNAAVEAAINDIEEATESVENLNIDVSDKVDGDVTVTLTKKDNTTKTVVLSDGTSLMFNWNGTSLGIKTDKDAEYVYVDLKGATGDTGPQGEPGQIKFKVVQTLPITDIDTNAIYLVPITPDEGDNNYAEYIYVNDSWELLGKIGVHADLSGYQPLIDSTHKLASDLIDDTNQTNQFVTANEKATWDSKLDNLVVLSYGKSTWSDFINAYRKNAVIYCRASSNANPATGSQTRMAFLAYVSDATNPTSVEFQYYRSVSSHSASQQGDQVFVYKLNNSGNWEVTIREASTKIVVDTGLSSSYNNGVLTLSNAQDISEKEDISNKVTSISSQSTDTQYPSAKCVYDIVGNIESLLAEV